jgi:hydroxymethylglutaryl-CoA reductase (NADPH)
VTPLGRIPRSPDDDHAPEAVARRHRLCEEVAGRPLPHLAGTPVPPSAARGKIEHLVGYAQVPVGLAGPLEVVPMATTEGAMVASYSRGMKVLAAAGGARARVVAEGLSQHPILVDDDAEAACLAAEVTRELEGELKALVGGLTRHGALARVTPQPVGRRLVLRLVFTTGDAIGINMAVLATERCSALVAERTDARERYVHGEDVEKRAHSSGMTEGRGRSAYAEVRVPRAVLEELLRVTPEQLAAIQKSYAVGFARLGTKNWMVQSANGLAAVLVACGQDVAYVAESAVGLLELEPTPEGDLYASAWLPALLVGTVGGGSGQGTAAECLDLLGVRGDGGANVFAEILAATLLAGDLSLMASFCTHEFVAAHERLGRNRPGGAPGT